MLDIFVGLFIEYDVRHIYHLLISLVFPAHPKDLGIRHKISAILCVLLHPVDSPIVLHQAAIVSIPILFEAYHAIRNFLGIFMDFIGETPGIILNGNAQVFQAGEILFEKFKNLVA